MALHWQKRRLRQDMHLLELSLADELLSELSELSELLRELLSGLELRSR